MFFDFEIRDHIFLVYGTHVLDLHNDFDFQSVHYCVESRTVILGWRRSIRDGVGKDLPPMLSIEFREVSEFRFQPRGRTLPFTEDDCLESFGYWTDENSVEGVIILGPGQKPDSEWLTALRFMSGAVIIVQATSAHAHIDP